jgi:hypothetical protein
MPQSQIYSTTKYYFRPVASKEPFFKGPYSSFLSETLSSNHRFESFKKKKLVIESRSEIQNAKNIIESLASAPHKMRFEQVMTYQIGNVQDFTMASFLPVHMPQFLLVFGIATQTLSGNEEIQDFCEDNITGKDFKYNTTAIKTFEENCNRAIQGEDDFNINLVTLLGVPMLALDLMWVKNHVWPGILVPYLDMFESLINTAIVSLNADVEAYIKTNELEVYGNAERIIQYLFSGDKRKLGQTRIVEVTGLADSLQQHNYPRMHSEFYNISFDRMPCIDTTAWPLHPHTEKILLNCFSEFYKEAASSRRLLYSLESCLEAHTETERLGTELFRFLRELSIQFYREKIQQTNISDALLEEDSGPIFGNTELLHVLKTKGIVKGDQSIHLRSWAEGLANALVSGDKGTKTPEIRALLRIFSLNWPTFARK